MGSIDRERFSSDKSIAKVVDDKELQVLNKFKQLLEEEKNLKCMTDDVNLLRFLRTKKLDADKALESLTNWWKTRDTMAYCHDGLYPSVYESLYTKGFCSVLSHRDKLKRQVILWKVGKWDPKETSFLDLFRSNFPILDTIAMRQETQLHGAVFIVDLKGLGLNHVAACGPSAMKILWYLTDGFPMRIKGIHIVNNNKLFNVIFTCSKPFLKEKMKQRIHFHGFNYSSLHQFVDKTILPEAYGGDLTNKEAEEEGLIPEVLSREQYFRDLFTVYGYNR